jgi:hypothetical protein
MKNRCQNRCHSLSWLARSVVAGVVLGLALSALWGATPARAAGVLVAPAKQSVTTQTGQDLALKFQITNQEDTPQRVKVVPQDVLEVSAGGLPKFAEASESASFQWVKSVSVTSNGQPTSTEKPFQGKQTVILQPGQAADVLVILQVPPSAEKAAYFFTIFFEFLDQVSSSNSAPPAQVLVERRVASLVALTLSDRRPEYALSITPDKWQYVTQPITGWALPVDMKNTGSVHQVLGGILQLNSILGAHVQSSTVINPEDQWLLPDQSLRPVLIDSGLNDWSFMIGRLKAIATLNGQPFQRRYLVVFIGRYAAVAAGAIGGVITLLCLWQIRMILQHRRHSHQAHE